jgi:hypothetical protein
VAAAYSRRVSRLVLLCPAFQGLPLSAAARRFEEEEEAVLQAGTSRRDRAQRAAQRLDRTGAEAPAARGGAPPVASPISSLGLGYRPLLVRSLPLKPITNSRLSTRGFSACLPEQVAGALRQVADGILSILGLDHGADPISPAQGGSEPRCRFESRLCTAKTFRTLAEGHALGASTEGKYRLN